MHEALTYAGSGVQYDGGLDAFKVLCQIAASRTESHLARHNLRAVPESRGESVFLVWDGERHIGVVHEGLGTKSLITTEVSAQTGFSYYYGSIAQDTLAMGINDISTLGVRPAMATMHFAVSSSDWFADPIRLTDLINGWEDACNAAKCTWVGGETPVLKDVLRQDAIELSCSVVGYIDDHHKRITGGIADGDRIVLISSSGVHANGLTLARAVADRLPDRYTTPVIAGEPLTFGEALLRPTPLYSPIVEAVQDAGGKINYAVNITGHGWRKLMRLNRGAHYVIEAIFQPQPEFKLIQDTAGIDDSEMYGTFNMGAGFALFVPRETVPIISAEAEKWGLTALDAGHIQLRENDSDRKVLINPLKIEFGPETMTLR
jgi:phosphoribosylformylglycinamidine cyclo-ligase